ncbi:DUF2933 domain-containing protein [Streptomyces sp. SLBN-31]|jgi:Protein of unknown function (DUF2933)|uniref:DUF2933 domain-containing protein n=1 Tax=Streptomyces sp. SLBN-31 TaxID=2768444 RepID=UPI001154B913|nr:DUF2933 domain-containing protein [Streptomyces sp. SLBN-31]TQJ92478.1 DUF2933 family protein [Streptomyces sp. SLBN-31]
MNTNQRNYGLYAVAAAIAVVGALALGLPVGTLFVLAIALSCPLMMFFMMRGIHGGGEAHAGHGTSHEPRTQDDLLTKHDRPPYDAGRT